VSDKPASNNGPAGGDTGGRGFAPSLDRFSAFSDGVFAIAITLLVLELSVPPAAAGVAQALWEARYEFLGYLMSFSFIGGIWLTHSSLTRLMKDADLESSGMNLLLLLFVAVLPFSTNLLVTHLYSPDVEAAVLFYGVNVLLASLTLSLLMFYVAKEPTLVVDGIADQRLRRLYVQRWFVVGINVFAILMALVSPMTAVALYLVTTVAVLAFPLLGLRRHRSRSNAGPAATGR
jgi:uncharacterized membrane protein